MREGGIEGGGKEELREEGRRNWGRREGGIEGIQKAQERRRKCRGKERSKGKHFP